MTTDRLDRQKFQKQNYWNERFKNESNDDTTQHEWFASYNCFKKPLLNHLSQQKSKNISEISRILVLGCGNSTLSFDLLEDFPNAVITSSDYSEAVIEIMAEKYRNEKRLRWVVQDMTKLGEGRGEQIDQDDQNKYDLVIEKGVLDALVAGSKSPFMENMDKNCKNMVKDSCYGISKILKNNGIFISISFACSLIRKPLLIMAEESSDNDQPSDGDLLIMNPYNWDVDIVPFVNSDGTGFEYFIYFCCLSSEKKAQERIVRKKNFVEEINLPENDIFGMDF